MAEYVDVILTDIQIHRLKPTNPKPMVDTFQKAARTGKPGRAYSSDLIVNSDGTLSMQIQLHGKSKREYESGKQVRFFLPKGGLPVYLGQDALEFMEAHERRQQKSKSKHLTK